MPPFPNSEFEQRLLYNDGLPSLLPMPQPIPEGDWLSPLSDDRPTYLEGLYPGQRSPYRSPTFSTTLPPAIFENPVIIENREIHEEEGITSGGLWYCIMFIFAPIPLDSLAAAVDIRAVARRCLPKLPSYLSRQSQMAIYFILAATNVCFYTWLLQLFSTVVLLSSQPFIRRESTLCLLTWWLIVGHLVLILRAWGRKLVGDALKEKGWAPEVTAYTELTIDIGFWNSVMAVYVVRTWILLGKGDIWTELRADGYTPPLTCSLALFAVYAVCNAWVIDIILRLAWVVIASLLEADFKGCLTFRVLESLPDTDVIEQCSICFDDTDTDGCEMPCKHIFHRSCLTGWARTRSTGAGLSCPMCRRVPELITSDRLERYRSYSSQSSDLRSPDLEDFVSSDMRWERAVTA